MSSSGPCALIVLSQARYEDKRHSPLCLYCGELDCTFFFEMLRSLWSSQTFLSALDYRDLLTRGQCFRPSGRTIPSTKGGASLSRDVDWLLQVKLHDLRESSIKTDG